MDSGQSAETVSVLNSKLGMRITDHSLQLPGVQGLSRKIAEKPSEPEVGGDHDEMASPGYVRTAVREVMAAVAVCTRSSQSISYHGVRGLHETPPRPN